MKNSINATGTVTKVNYRNFTDNFKKVYENENFVFCLIKGEKAMLKKEGKKLMQPYHTFVKSYTENEITKLINTISEKYNMLGSGASCSSYKKINNKQFRLSNHGTTDKWAGCYGYADVDCIVSKEMTKEKVDSKIKNFINKLINN